MMSSTWLMLVLKSPTMAWVESTSRCNAGPRPPTDSAVSSSNCPILSFGSTVKPRLAVSRAGPISLGTVPLVMVCPGEKNPCALPCETRSRYCSPTADTECTFAGRVERDLELAVDAHRRLGTLFGGLDGGDLADGDAAIGHVGCRVQATRGRQLSLQLVLADTHQRRNTQVVDTQDQQGHRSQDAEDDQLALDETSQHCRSALSTSGPPGRRWGSACSARPEPSPRGHGRTTARVPATRRRTRSR